MSLSNKLGTSFANVADKVKVKVVHIKTDEAEFDLRIKIPLKAEFETIMTEILTPNEERVNEIYEKSAKPFQEQIDKGGQEFLDTINNDKDYIVVKDNDLIVDGNSIRQYAMLTAMSEKKIERYFQLIISDTDVPVNETYQEIMAQLPEEVVKIILDEIEKAIRPNYDSVKKN